MANVTTRVIMLNRARQLADRVSSTFVTDSEINTWIDVEGSELHDILVSKFENYVATTGSISLVAGTAAYSLPTDFYKALYVDVTEAGRVHTLRPYMVQERNRRQDGVGVLRAMQYMLFGQQIKFIPTPSVSVASGITIGYVPQYVPLAADSTVVHASIPQGWEEYIVAGVAMRILMKDESDYSGPASIKAAMLQRIELAAADRDTGEPARIVDVSRRWLKDDYPDMWGA